MGNACGCADGNVGDAPVTNINLVKAQPEPFKLTAHKTAIVAEAFAGLSASDKDQLLAEVLRLIVTKGDAAQIKTNNTHLKILLNKQTNHKIPVGGDIYEGDVIDGTANGKGKIKLTSGADFDGQFVGGFRRAKGVTKQPNLTEEAYYGEDGQPEGQAIYKAANGLFQVLYFERGLKNGPAYSDATNERLFELYIANKRNGLTAKIAKDLKTLSLQEYKDDKPNGAVLEYVPKAATQPAPQASADPKAATQAPADPKAAAQPGQPAPQPGQPTPQAAPQPGQPAPANAAPGKPADPKAGAPQEKGPAQAPVQAAPANPPAQQAAPQKP
jgi:hypothetical protein